MSKMKDMQLYENHLQGSIPERLTNMVQMTVFHLDVNSLSRSIQVMTIILTMTDCDSNKFIQTQLFRCVDPCTKKSFITFKQDAFKKHISELQSTASNSSCRRTLQTCLRVLSLATTKVLRGAQLHLRKQPKGYAGLDGARKSFNEMMLESMSK